MTKNDIIDYLYHINAVRMYGYKNLRFFTAEQQRDLESEVWLNICEIPEELLISLWNQSEKNLTAYIKTFVERQLSNTGKTRHLQQMFKFEIPKDNFVNNEEDD